MRFGVFGFRLRRRLFQRFLIENDRLLHQHHLDFLLAIHLQLAQFAFAPDAGLVEPTVGSNPRALHLLVRGDLGLLQRLDAADFELFDDAPALEPDRFQRLLLRHLGGLDVAAGDDFSLLDLPIGVDALGALRR